MKAYMKPQAETFSAKVTRNLCQMSDLHVDGGKNVGSAWTRRQELWGEEEDKW